METLLIEMLLWVNTENIFFLTSQLNVFEHCAKRLVEINLTRSRDFLKTCQLAHKTQIWVGELESREWNWAKIRLDGIKWNFCAWRGTLSREKFLKSLWWELLLVLLYPHSTFFLLMMFNQLLFAEYAWSIPGYFSYFLTDATKSSLLILIGNT
jgi:hypothetical protein